MNALPGWLNAPERLLLYLRAAGLGVGTGEALRATAVLSRLREQGRAPQTREETARYLAPLVCTTPEQQARLAPLIDAFVTAEGASGEEPSVRPPYMEPPLRGGEERHGGMPRRTVWGAMGVFAGVLLVLVAIWLAPRGGPTAPPGPARNVGAAAQPFDTAAVLRVLSALALGLIYSMPAWMAWFWYRRRCRSQAPVLRRVQERASQMLDLQPKPGSLPLFGGADLRAGLQAMRRHRQVPTDRLDVERSLGATIAAGGRPVFVNATEPRLPEYPLVVEQLSGKDHMAALGAAIAERLRQEGVAFTRYYCGSDPRQVRDTARRALSLADVAARHGEEMLLLVSDGDALFDPMLGEIRPWVRELAAWRRAVLLTPVPLACWSAREQALTAQGLIVLPATPEGLVRLGEFIRRGEEWPLPVVPAGRGEPGLLVREGRRSLGWQSDTPPDPEEREEVLQALAASLPQRAFDLVSVLALFGEVRLDLTLSAGRCEQLGRNGSALLDEANFAALAWLPWFRLGRMPDWLRQDLAECLGPRQLDEARKFYRDWLSETEGGKGTLTVLPDSRWFQWLRRRAAAGGPARDVLFLTFMRERRVDSLDLQAPPDWGRLLGIGWADPVWIAGGGCALLTLVTAVWAGEIKARLAGAADAGAAALTLSFLFVCLGLVAFHVRALGGALPRRVSWLLSPALYGALAVAGIAFGVSAFAPPMSGKPEQLALALFWLAMSAGTAALGSVDPSPVKRAPLRMDGSFRLRPPELVAFAAALVVASASVRLGNNVEIVLAAVVAPAVGGGVLARALSRATGEASAGLFLYSAVAAVAGIFVWLSFAAAVEFSFVQDPQPFPFVLIAAVYGLLLGLWRRGRTRLGPVAAATAISWLAAAAVVLAAGPRLAASFPYSAIPILPVSWFLAYVAVFRQDTLWRAVTWANAFMLAVAAMGLAFWVHSAGLDVSVHAPFLNESFQIVWVAAGAGVMAGYQALLLLPIFLGLHWALLHGWPRRPFELAFSEDDIGRLMQKTVAGLRLFILVTVPLWVATSLAAPLAGLVLCVVAWAGARFAMAAQRAVLWGVAPLLVGVALGVAGYEQGLANVGQLFTRWWLAQPTDAELGALMLARTPDPGLAVAAYLVFRLYADPTFRGACFMAERVPVALTATALLVLGMQVELTAGGGTIGGSLLLGLEVTLLLFAASRAKLWPLIAWVVGAAAVGTGLSLLPAVQVAGISVRYALNGVGEAGTALIFLAVGALLGRRVRDPAALVPRHHLIAEAGAALFGIPLLAVLSSVTSVVGPHGPPYYVWSPLLLLCFTLGFDLHRARPRLSEPAWLASTRGGLPGVFGVGAVAAVSSSLIALVGQAGLTSPKIAPVVIIATGVSGLAVALFGYLTSFGVSLGAGAVSRRELPRRTDRRMKRAAA